MSIISLRCVLKDDAHVSFGLTLDTTDKLWLATGNDRKKFFTSDGGRIFDFIPTVTYLYPHDSRKQVGAISGLDLSTVVNGSPGSGESYETAALFIWTAQ